MSDLPPILLTPFDPNVGYCGINIPFNLPASHPFNYSCYLHDNDYELRKQGMLPDEPTSEQADNRFLERNLELCEGLPLEAVRCFYHGEAEMFYELCEIVGKWRWPEPPQ